MNRSWPALAFLAALLFAATQSASAPQHTDVFNPGASPNSSSQLLPPKIPPVSPYSLPLHGGSLHHSARDVSPIRASYPSGALLVANPEKFLPARVLDRREIAQDLFI